MPRRASARTANSSLPSQDSFSTSNHPPAQPFSAELTALRTNWKWAAFSQFFYTFSQLFNMEDVTLQNIEDDLVQGSSVVLPRIVLKLLVILSNDRKLNLDNWQTALRRQYNRRDPLANPIGPEPPKTSTNSRYTSVIEEDEEENLDAANHYKPEESPHENGLRASTSRIQSSSPSRAQTPASQTIGIPGVNDEEEKLLPTKKALKSQSLGPTATAELPELAETKDWNSLSMLEKLDSMHLLTEWLFHNPARVRVLMKSDDEAAEWRIEPIGYDAKRNAYWLIGADRLWIQRVVPRPPRPAKSSNKRKRGTTEEVKPKNAKKAKSAHKTTTARTKGKEKAKVNGKVKEEPSTPGRRGRAAKEKANVLLDVQAKQLAELNRQAAATAKSNGRASRSSSNKQPPPAPTPSRLTRNSSSSSRPLGTRISARLRGAQEDDDEWQAIPAEWLDNKDEDEDEDEEGRTGLDSSALSDLTELSDADNEDDVEEEEERQEETEEDDGDEGAAEEVNEKPKVEELEEPEEPALPEGFVEWETICVTLYEWEHIAERWQNATHYAEKALYKILTKHIVPVIVEELRAIENKRRMEEAIVHRKRSSRIAIKESEKEEARLAAQRKVEAEEKMGRARRAEARQKKEESERMKRELAREQRRKEREAQAEAQTEEREESTPVDVDDTMEGKSEPRPKKNQTTASVNGLSSGARTPAGDDWELDCEICHRRGINVDDGVPLMSCGKCFKWQHIPCHDKADRKAGLPRRNWEDVEFFCRQCRSKMFTPAPSWNSTVNAYRGQIPQNIHLNPPLPPNRHPSLTPHSNISAYPQSSYQLPANYSDMRSSVGYVNGYDRMATSDVRSSQSNPPQHVKPIAFQHYQPPQQGYSASQPPPQYNVNLGAQVQPYGQQIPPTSFHHAMTNGQSTPDRSAPNEGWIQHDFSRPYTNYNNSAERASAAPLPQHYRSPQQQHQQWPSQPTQLPTNTPYSPYPSSS